MSLNLESESLLPRTMIKSSCLLYLSMGIEVRLERQPPAELVNPVFMPE